MTLRFLVVEGNIRSTREQHKAGFGMTSSESYASVLTSLAPDARCDIAFPADEGANLPDGASLADYDGVVLTGSALHLWDREPAVERQIELARAVFRAQTPFFGSCWGLQVASVAAGGDVAKNPAGFEVGYARNIVPTEAGRAHPLLRGRPEAFDAPAIHLDAVTALPPDAIVLARNAMTPIQAAEIRHDGGVFWGVQYHPEFSLRHVAVIIGRLVPRMIAEGYFADEASARTLIDDWHALEAEPGRSDLAWRYALGAEITQEPLRLTEIRNWIEARVRPQQAARGRG